jgi:predicted phage-related endonuclease
VYVDKRVEAPAEGRLPLKDPRFWGNVMEQPMLRAVAEYHGWKYRPGGALLKSRKHPLLGATIDAEIDRGDGVWCDFEGKTTELMGDWDEETGQLPTRVVLQVQTQLLVTGAEVAVVFALLRRYKPVQITVYPRPELHEVIVQYAEWFMDLVARGERPPADGSEAARRALHKLFPVDDGTIVDLPPEAIGWTSEYQDVCEQLRELEARKRFLQNQLKDAIGSAKYGLLSEPVGNKSVWRWQTQKRVSYEVEESEQRVLLAMKDPPQGARVGRHPQLSTPLEDSLRASLEEDEEPAKVIRLGAKRRRSRR